MANRVPYDQRENTDISGLNKPAVDRLSAVTFPDPDGWFKQKAEPILSGHIKMKNCYFSKGMRPQVKLFFGRQQHVITTTTWQSAVKALRLADAAVLYFWKYRRIRRYPEDADFNFSHDTAKKDLENIEWIADHLRSIESVIRSRGQLPAPFDRIDSRDLQPARLRMMQLWREFSEHFRMVWFQCPITPMTKSNLSIAKEKISELDNILRTVNVVVRDVNQAPVQQPKLDETNPLFQ